MWNAEYGVKLTASVNFTPVANDDIAALKTFELS